MTAENWSLNQVLQRHPDAEVLRESVEHAAKAQRAVLILFGPGSEGLHLRIEAVWSDVRTVFRGRLRSVLSPVMISLFSAYRKATIGFSLQ